MKSWVRFKNVEVKRDGYYVSYSPKLVNDAKDDSSAILSVRFLNEYPLKDCKVIAESEFEYWIKLYPVPLQLIVKFEYKTTKRISSITEYPYICGVSVKDYRWGGFLEGELSSNMPSNNDLKLIYGDLSSTSSEEVDKELNQRLLGVRVVKWLVLLIAVIIPALIALLGWAHPFFSGLALLFAWYKCADKWLSLSGQKLKTEAELATEKDQQLKEHHHYHCKLNPEGFERLKLENLQVDKEECLMKKLERMESREIEN